MTDITIRIRRHTLTDKSHVFDVVIAQDGQFITIPAITEAAAYALQEKLADEINERSVSVAEAAVW
jgi:hypothetical protein